MSRPERIRFSPMISLMTLRNNAISLFALALSACAGETAPPAAAATPNATAEQPVIASTALGAYLAARHAERQRDHDAVARFLEQALAREPNNFELLGRTHLALVNAGRFNEAIPLARRIVDQSSANPQANLTLAVVDLRDGRHDDAAKRLRDLPTQGVNRLLLPMLRAWAEAGAGRTVAALDALRMPGEVQGFRPLVDLHAGLINDIAGRGDEADAAFARALATERTPWPRMIEGAAGAMAARGKRDEARALIAKHRGAYLDTLLLDDALRRINGGADARLVRNTRGGAAEVLYDLANALLTEAGGAFALTFGRYALALQPDDPNMVLLVADVLDRQRRPADANALLQRVPAQSPVSWHARLRIAENLHELKQSDDAAKLLTAMADERKDRIDALIQLGSMRRQQERFAEAAEAYDRAIGRIGQLEPRHAKLLFYRGIALERSKQWPRAEQDFQKSLELSPENPDVMNYLAYSWVDLGVAERYDEALKMLRRAVELRPDSGHIIDSLAWALYRLGRYGDAVPLLERATELVPTESVVLDHLGDAYWRVGRRVEARYQWRRALANKPEPDQKPIIEKKLENGLPDIEPGKRGG
jgi:tetratricopeptide (TPR) repeat protein